MGPLLPGLGNGQPIGISLSLTPPIAAAALLSVRGGPRADARRYDRWGQALEVTLTLGANLGVLFCQLNIPFPETRRTAASAASMQR